ncbi:hypothetical protein N431DRAFT_320380, partial [Stipitochalara longipes BDJ]
GGYMATLEIFHQIHCLVSAYPDVMRNHLDHCIEIIRQVLMCNADLGLITFHWVKDNPTPYPDFNTWHTCRDPEAILALAKEN